MNYTCKHCSQEMPKEAFISSKRTISGIIKVCRKCHYRIRKEKLFSNPELHEQKKKASKEHYQLKKLDPVWFGNYCKVHKAYRSKNREKYLFLACKKRALVEKVPFDLSVEDIVIPTHCPILEVPLLLEESKLNLRGASIDRVNPLLGYVKSNIQIICRKANMMKLNASKQELELFAKNIIPYLNENYKESKEIKKEI